MSRQKNKGILPASKNRVLSEGSKRTGSKNVKTQGKKYYCLDIFAFLTTK
jgi:hypothetical protein